MPTTLEVRTGNKTKLIDITSRVQEVVADSGVTEGLCHVFVPHTTAGVTINENADPSVKADILMVLNKIISDREPYRHGEGNSPAHIKATLWAPSSPSSSAGAACSWAPGRASISANSTGPATGGCWSRSPRADGREAEILQRGQA